jgi:hypothetical protein
MVDKFQIVYLKNNNMDTQQTVYKNLVKFARPEIDAFTMFDYLTSGEEVIVTWNKLNGSGVRRRMVYGPELGGASYDYEALGYMVMDDLTKGDWRTVVMDNVKAITYRGITYNVI